MNYEFIYMVKGMWPKKAKYKVYIFTWDSIGINYKNVLTVNVQKLMYHCRCEV